MDTQVMDVTKLPEVDEHVRYGQEVVEKATDFPVETAEDMEAAAGIRQTIKDRQKAIVGLLEPFIKGAHALHKAHTTRRKEIIAPLEEAEGILNKKMVAWQTKEEARLAEEQKKLDEQAKLDAAVQAEEEGNEALAEAIIEDQVPVTAAPVEKAKTNGVSFTEKWTFQIEDESKIPREFLVPDEKMIRTTVTAMKDRAVIPGVRIYKEKNIKSARKDMSKRTW
jgi:hypothetical protein